MIGAVLRAGANLASSEAAQAASVAAASFKRVSRPPNKVPGGLRQVRARAVVGSEMQAEASGLLGRRCGSVGRVRQPQDVPLGRDVITLRAECTTGGFQILVVDTVEHVKPWTGVLRD